MQPLHPKVKVPAIIGFLLTLALAIAAVVGGFIPAAAPITAGVATVLQVASGYMSYAKLKVPAIVGTALTLTTAALAAVGTGMPEAVPFIGALTTVLNAASGGLTFAPASLDT